MGRPKVHGDRAATDVRFDADVLEALRETADDMGVSVNWLVNQAAIRYLNTLELPLKLTRQGGPPTMTDTAAR